jgi:hypothetical protein
MYQMPQNRENCVKSCKGTDGVKKKNVKHFNFSEASLVAGVGVLRLLLDLKKGPGSNLRKPFCVSFFETTQEIIPTENPPFYL